MLQYFDTLTDDSGNSLLGATVAVTNYPSGTPATIYSSNGTTQPIANSTVVADITGQVSFFAPDGSYTLTYAYKGTTYKTRSPVQFLDPMGFVAAADGGGAANAYAVTGAQYPAQKYVGLKLEVQAAHTNTGAATLTYQGDAGFAINQPGGSALVPGMVQSTGLFRVEWDGTQWQLLGAQSQPFYAVSTAETAAAAALSVSTVVINSAYPPGDLRRYGADTTNTNLSDTAILYGMTAASQSGGLGYILHPGGTIKFQNQITLINGVSILGIDRAGCVFNFVGTPSGSPAATRSAIRYTGVAPWSGYANIMLRHFKIVYANTVNFAAAIEISAWGWAYWEIDDVWVSGNCSYGIILDGAEICAVHNCLIENLNALVNYQIWLVNGADRGFTQGQGFTNIITVRECQISGGTGALGVVDDGGNGHVIQNNNFNQQRFALTMSGMTAFKVVGNSFETTLTSGSANVLVGSSTQAGVPCGQCLGGSIEGNEFAGALSSGSMLVFSLTTANISNITQAANAVVTLSTVSTVNPLVVGQPVYFSGVNGMTQINGLGWTVFSIGGSSGAWTATFQGLNTSSFTAYSSAGTVGLYSGGLMVSGNDFLATTNRQAAIDVTGLGNSRCTCNNDYGNSGMFHYTGVHTDNMGNYLDPPMNGFPGILNINGPTNYNTQFQEIKSSGLVLVRNVLTYSASMTPNALQGNYFTITVTNGSAFTINAPLNPLNGEMIQFVIRNASGGALGAITWNAVFKINATAIAPANGQSRSIGFLYDGANWVEQWRGANDVPN